MTDLCDKHWGVDRDEFDPERLVCPDCEYERWVKLVDKLEVAKDEGVDIIIKQRGTINELKDMVGAIAEKAYTQGWTDGNMNVGWTAQDRKDRCVKIIEAFQEGK
jgi:hypothetical protein